MAVHGEGAEQDQAVRAAVRRQLGQNVSQRRAAQCTWALAFGILLSCSTCGIVLNKFIVSKEGPLLGYVIGVHESNFKEKKRGVLSIDPLSPSIDPLSRRLASRRVDWPGVSWIRLPSRGLVCCLVDWSAVLSIGPPSRQSISSIGPPSRRVARRRIDWPAASSIGPLSRRLARCLVGWPAVSSIGPSSCRVARRRVEFMEKELNRIKLFAQQFAKVVVDWAKM